MLFPMAILDVEFLGSVSHPGIANKTYVVAFSCCANTSDTISTPTATHITQNQHTYTKRKIHTHPHRHTQPHTQHEIHTHNNNNNNNTHTPPNPHTHISKQRRVQSRSKSERKTQHAFTKKLAVSRDYEIPTFSTTHRASAKALHLVADGSPVDALKHSFQLLVQRLAHVLVGAITRITRRAGLSSARLAWQR